jgi:indolepyruvate ferredoxin oxidoreductase beta subunit
VTTDIVLAGVGGQGVLSVAAVIAEAARRHGLQVTQGEIHGMAQRGGAVQAQLRISDRAIASGLIPQGGADLILAMEPLESLRYLEYLRDGGALVAATEPHTNIPDYPDVVGIRERIAAIPGAVLIDAARLSREAGSGRAANMVMIGAAARFLPVTPETLEACIAEGFAAKGQRVVDANLKAFRAGREAAVTTE